MERRPHFGALPSLQGWLILAPQMLGAQVRPLDSTSSGHHVGAGGKGHLLLISVTAQVIT